MGEGIDNMILKKCPRIMMNRINYARTQAKYMKTLA